jgi:hypothetical protein
MVFHYFYNVVSLAGERVMKFAGLWHITEMDNWDEDYFNMEVQAYVEITDRGAGNVWRFGLK